MNMVVRVAIGLAVAIAVFVLAVICVGFWGTASFGWGGHPPVTVGNGPATVATPQSTDAVRPATAAPGNQSAVDAIVNGVSDRLGKGIDALGRDVSDIKETVAGHGKRLEQLEAARSVPVRSCDGYSPPPGCWDPPRAPVR